MSKALVSHHELQKWVQNLLFRAGLTEDHAAIIAKVFVRASLRGVGHHDISYLPQRLMWLTQNLVNARPTLKKTGGFAALETYDAERGLGEWAVSSITQRAIELSDQYGIGMTSVRQSNHFLAASPYIDMGIEKNKIILVWSNTDKTMRYPGGDHAIIGNNPLALGFPSTGIPVMLDICMAYASLGTLKAHVDQGTEVPSFWGVDKNGVSSSDPRRILEGGAISPMGEHKGFGLAFATELLTGVLSNGHSLDQIAEGGGLNTHSQTVLALNTEVFPDAATYKARVSDLGKRLKQSDSKARFPGERSAQALESAIEKGIELDKSLVQTLFDWSRDLGLGSPDYPKITEKS